MLLLERGRMIEHVTDYHTATMNPREFPHHNQAMPLEVVKRYPIQNRTGFTITEATHQFFVNDLKNLYVEAKPFDRSGGPVDPGLSRWRQITDVGALLVSLLQP